MDLTNEPQLKPRWAVCPVIGFQDRTDDEHPDQPRSPKLFDTKESAIEFLDSPVGVRRVEHCEKADLFKRFTPRDDGWEGPFSVVGVDTQQSLPAMTFKEFLPPLPKIVGYVPGSTMGNLIDYACRHHVPPEQYRCVLADDWNFSELEGNIWKRKGHQFEGREYETVGEIVVAAVYDFDTILTDLRSDLSAHAVANFFMSWQLWRHIATFCRDVVQSSTGKNAAARALKNHARATGETVEIESPDQSWWYFNYEWISLQITAYAYELTRSRGERELESYASHAETIANVKTLQPVPSTTPATAEPPAAPEPLPGEPKQLSSPAVPAKIGRPPEPRVNAAKLKEKRSAFRGDDGHRLTQEGLAEKADVGFHDVKRAEGGKGLCSETITKIARALSISADDLIIDDESSDGPDIASSL